MDRRLSENRCLSCYNDFSTRKALSHHLLMVHGQRLPYASRRPVDLNASDLRAASSRHGTISDVPTTPCLKRRGRQHRQQRDVPGIGTLRMERKSDGGDCVPAWAHHHRERERQGNGTPCPPWAHVLPRLEHPQTRTPFVPYLDHWTALKIFRAASSLLRPRPLRQRHPGGYWSIPLPSSRRH